VNQALGKTGTGLALALARSTPGFPACGGHLPAQRRGVVRLHGATNKKERRRFQRHELQPFEPLTNPGSAAGHSPPTSNGLHARPERRKEVEERARDGIHSTSTHSLLPDSSGHVACSAASLYLRRSESEPMRSDTIAHTTSEGSQGPAEDYLETTRQFWQRYTDRTLTREDAREMAHNLLGFFSVLRAWTIAERKREASGQDMPDTPLSRPVGRPRKKSTRRKKKRRSR
jgi:hypothetical protein